MPKKSGGNLLGAWAFLIGVILAVVFGFFDTTSMTWLPWVLAVIGLLIGLLNIADSEVQPFLIAGFVLVFVSASGMSIFQGLKLGNIAFLSSILYNMLVVFVPATIIVALKSIFAKARA